VVVADTAGFPDTNPVITTAPNGEVQLYYGTQLDNNWESTLLKQRIGRVRGTTGCRIEWSRDNIVHLKPDEEAFRRQYLPGLRTVYAGATPADVFPKYYAIQEERSQKRLNIRLGWMGRCTPVWVASQLYLPLYHDGFDVGLVAMSSDGGTTFTAGGPIVGRAAVQPSLVRLADGSWMAYNRNNGPGPMRILAAKSVDGCKSWTLATEMSLPNPGVSVAVDRHRDGTLVLVGNDTEEGRHSLAFWCSRDEGQSWSTATTIEAAPAGSDWSFHYPNMVRLPSGNLGLVYSRYAKAGQTIRFVEITQKHLQL
jgi:hypothetical protein